MKTIWVTFYSYKGGVGRTNALANVAGKLAKMGRRVVMIDFDLEAPGLDSYPEFAKTRKQGVVEYIHRFLQDHSTPPIDKYVHMCPADDRVVGNLWLMPAGLRDEKYPERLHNINWSKMYEDEIAGSLIANWKMAIERKYSPDYVLIDSRTGLTDIGGVCTLHFPDINVLLLTLNNQSMEGTAAVLRSISQASESRPIETLTIASPLPSMTAQEFTEVSERAKETLGKQLSGRISYHAAVASLEHVWTLDEKPSADLTPQYEELAKLITGRARDGLDFYLSQVEQMFKTGNMAQADEIGDHLVDQYGDRLVALRAAAKLARINQQRDKASKLARKILELLPVDTDSFSWLVNDFYQSHDTTGLKIFLDELSEKLRVTRGNYANLAAARSAVGQAYMKIRDYDAAFLSYMQAKELSSNGGNAIGLTFNALEAKRREQKQVPADGLALWKNIIPLADEAIKNAIQVGGADDNPVVSYAANSFQALSIAYAIVGNIDYARELLLRAERLARTMNAAVRLFSVIDYEDVSRDRFLEQNRLMLQALDRGELWDGLKVPVVA